MHKEAVEGAGSVCGGGGSMRIRAKEQRQVGLGTGQEADQMFNKLRLDSRRLERQVREPLEAAGGSKQARPVDRGSEGAPSARIPERIMCGNSRGDEEAN